MLLLYSEMSTENVNRKLIPVYNGGGVGHGGQGLWRGGGGGWSRGEKPRDKRGRDAGTMNIGCSLLLSESAARRPTNAIKRLIFNGVAGNQWVALERARGRCLQQLLCVHTLKRL